MQNVVHKGEIPAVPASRSFKPLPTRAFRGPGRFVPQFLNSFHTIIHSGCAQHLVIDRQRLSYILRLGHAGNPIWVQRQREASELFPRIVAVGVIAIAVFSGLPGLAQATGVSGWTSGYPQSKRPMFRPWQPRAQHDQRHMRWRPQQRATGYASPAPRYQAASRQPALILPERSSPPVTRAFARSSTSGVRFRPNGRIGSGPSGIGPNVPIVEVATPGLQSQFRPQTRQRVPYEQLQARVDSTRHYWTPYGSAAGISAPAAAFQAPSARAGYWRTW